MKENFPNLAKEIDFQEVQEAQRVPKSWTQEGPHQGTSKLHQMKDEREGEILKAAREKETVTYNGVPIRL